MTRYTPHLITTVHLHDRDVALRAWFALLLDQLSSINVLLFALVTIQFDGVAVLAGLHVTYRAYPVRVNKAVTVLVFTRKLVLLDNTLLDVHTSHCGNLGIVEGNTASHETPLFKMLESSWDQLVFFYVLLEGFFQCSNCTLDSPDVLAFLNLWQRTRNKKHLFLEDEFLDVRAIELVNVRLSKETNQGRPRKLLLAVHTVLLCLLQGINVVLDTGSTTLKLAVKTLFDVRLRYFGDTYHALNHIAGRSGGSGGSGRSSSNSGSGSRHVFGFLIGPSSYQFLDIPVHIYPIGILIN